MQSVHCLLASGKLSRSIIIVALFLACLPPLIVYKFWNPSERWGFSNPLPQWRPAQSHPSTIPRKLWYKLGPKGLNDETRAWTDSCIKNNTDYEVEFMTESSGDSYVRNKFGATDPDLVEMYLGLTVPIFKADILRYLLLFSEGGVYCDLDVSCEVPINEWIPRQYEGNASVVVGWEFDVGWPGNFIRQFTTWSIMAKPGSPHMWMVVQDILQSFRDKMEEENVTIEGLTLEILGDVVDVTGPRRFTRSILKSVEAAYNTTLQDMQELLEPKLAGDVLVLPGYAFAASANTYDEAMDVPPPLLKHHYAGTWKNEKGGETV
ncbi:uncharacterized protein B0H64DRAFT_400996 [Chaetomium fimeti]|uniref:Initiation-specific alpha-1,6-mannosyltransferase n=1 Tax=Chaetomium fimeti TaxID=1854472 RepID=A0AAE0LQW4_9PEZI|nr:hypothetical protein B0H64DRAFT_400996 [Chaetomium fimeti]